MIVEIEAEYTYRFIEATGNDAVASGKLSSMMMCSQFGTAAYVDLGLRSDVSAHNDPHYTVVWFEDLASRADWAVCEYEDCNHAPVVTADAQDFVVKAGESVTLSGSAIDPDGNELATKWWAPAGSNEYIIGKDAEEKPVKGDLTSLKITENDAWSATVTIPEDAVAGSVFVINLEVTDQGVEHPMARFAQYVLTVE